MEFFGHRFRTINENADDEKKKREPSSEIQDSRGLTDTLANKVDQITTCEKKTAHGEKEGGFENHPKSIGFAVPHCRWKPIASVPVHGFEQGKANNKHQQAEWA